MVLNYNQLEEFWEDPLPAMKLATLTIFLAWKETKWKCIQSEAEFNELSSYLTTFVWTMPGETQTTLMPDSAGKRFCNMLLNMTWKTEIKPLRFIL